MSYLFYFCVIIDLLDILDSLIFHSLSHSFTHSHLGLCIHFDRDFLFRCAK